MNLADLLLGGKKPELFDPNQYIWSETSPVDFYNMEESTLSIDRFVRNLIDMNKEGMGNGFQKRIG